MSEPWDVAVIGMGVLLPKVKTISELHELLMVKGDVIGNVPSKRQALVNSFGENEFIPAGYIDDIECFDYKFFQISKQEAEHMEPQQRIALQLACEVIEHAGYRVSDFKGTKTSVIMSASNNQYELLLPPSGITLMGNLTAMLAGKIAYHLDLRGPVLMLDTSCSSSLVAVHEACKELFFREVDTALVGGINIQTFFPKFDDNHSIDVLGIASPTGRSYTFDKKANGTGSGEGAGMVLLKRLDDALADKDNIYAVIKGSAINHDGNRSNSIAAPNPKAQTEVIIEAWKRAKIHPRTIGYIEAHGTGTKLGDPIEIKAISDAFKSYTNDRGFCGISTIKTNVGHIGNAAGVVGFIKAVLSVYHGKKYPLVHYKKPNPLIQFSDSAVYPIENVQEWDEERRKAGVSSFGLSGTNTHVVLEKLSERVEEINDETRENEFLITLSAKNDSALREYLSRMLVFLKSTKVSIEEISFGLNKGRDDYLNRIALVVHSKKELINQMEEIRNDLNQKRKNKSGDTLLIYLCSGNINVLNEHVQILCEGYQEFNNVWEELIKCNGTADIGMRTIAFQYGIYKVWESYGLTPSEILGAGVGSITVEVITGNISLQEAFNQSQTTRLSNSFNQSKFQNYIKELVQKNERVFIELGMDSELLKSIKTNFSKLAYQSYYHVPVRKEWLNVLANLYEVGVQIDWERFYDGKKIKKIVLPTYPFEKLHCWFNETKKSTEGKRFQGSPNNAVNINKINDLTYQIQEIWEEVLGQPVHGENVDFFEIGGNSLMGMNLIVKMKERLNIKMEFEQLYETPTIRTLNEWVQSQYYKEKEIKKEMTMLFQRERNSEKIPLSPFQKMMYYLYLTNSNSPFYNLPAKIKLQGNVSKEGIEFALQAIVRKHEILRTIYQSDEGNLYQKILSSALVNLAYYDFSHLNSKKAEAYAIRLFEDDVMKPFNIEQEIPIRAQLMKVNKKEQWLTVNFHHIAVDGWSIGVFMKELSAEYNAYVCGNKEDNREALNLQYADYSYWMKEWLQTKEADRKIQYWLKQLEGAQPLEFAGDFPKPVHMSTSGDCYKFKMDNDLWKRIKGFCREEKITEFVFLYTAYAITMYRYTEQTDFSIAVPVANRSLVELKSLIGNFVNIIVIRTIVDGNTTVHHMLTKMKKVIKEGISAQEIPFEHLVEIVQPERKIGLIPFVQHAFAFQNFESISLELEGITSINIDTKTKGAKFDISFILREVNEGCIGMIEYATDLYKTTSMERLVQHFFNIAESMLINQDQTLLMLPMITSREEELIYQFATDSDENFDF
ncbi:MULTISPECIES: condensation domain-containing protein [unclassified Bacillus cereus group]|nr:MULTISPECIES: condensation domain-containing protein [unclassified Bacillus cereus group]